MIRFSFGGTFKHYVYIFTFIRTFNMKAEFNVLVPLDVAAYKYYKPYAEGIFQSLPPITMEDRL